MKKKVYTSGRNLFKLTFLMSVACVMAFNISIAGGMDLSPRLPRRVVDDVILQSPDGVPMQSETINTGEFDLTLKYVYPSLLKPLLLSATALGCVVGTKVVLDSVKQLSHKGMLSQAGILAATIMTVGSSMSSVQAARGFIDAISPRANFFRGSVECDYLSLHRNQKLNVLLAQGHNQLVKDWDFKTMKPMYFGLSACGALAGLIGMQNSEPMGKYIVLSACTSFYGLWKYFAPHFPYDISADDLPRAIYDLLPHKMKNSYNSHRRVRIINDILKVPNITTIARYLRIKNAFIALDQERSEGAGHIENPVNSPAAFTFVTQLTVGGGVSREVIGEDKSCCSCMTDYSQIGKRAKLACLHTMCPTCLNTQLYHSDANNGCPLCRHPISFDQFPEEFLEEYIDRVSLPENGGFDSRLALISGLLAIRDARSALNSILSPGDGQYDLSDSESSDSESSDSDDDSSDSSLPFNRLMRDIRDIEEILNRDDELSPSDDDQNSGGRLEVVEAHAVNSSDNESSSSEDDNQNSGGRFEVAGTYGLDINVDKSAIFNRASTAHDIYNVLPSEKRKPETKERALEIIDAVLKQEELDPLTRYSTILVELRKLDPENGNQDNEVRSDAGNYGEESSSSDSDSGFDEDAMSSGDDDLSSSWDELGINGCVVDHNINELSVSDDESGYQGDESDLSDYEQD